MHEERPKNSIGALSVTWMKGHQLPEKPFLKEVESLVSVGIINRIQFLGQVPRAFVCSHELVMDETRVTRQTTPFGPIPDVVAINFPSLEEIQVLVPDIEVDGVEVAGDGLRVGLLGRPRPVEVVRDPAREPGQDAAGFGVNHVVEFSFEEEVGVPGAGEDVGVGVDVAREAAPFRVDVQGVPEARPVVLVFVHPEVVSAEEVGVVGERAVGAPAQEVEDGAELTHAAAVDPLDELPVLPAQLEALVGQHLLVHGVHDGVVPEHVTQAEHVPYFVHRNLQEVRAVVGVEGEVLIVVHVDLGVAGVPQGVAQLSAQPVELGHAAEVTSSSESDVDVRVIGIVRRVVLYEDFGDDFRPHSEGEGEGGALDTYRQLGAVARRHQPPSDQALHKLLAQVGER